MPRRSILVVVASFALLAASCASDGGGASPAPSAPAASAPVASEGAGGSCTTSTASPAVDVTMRGSAFSEGRVEASVGEVIGFVNEDAVPHTATLDDGSCTTPNLGQGDTGALVFSAAGEYPFHCKIHPAMTGTFVISG